MQQGCDSSFAGTTADFDQAFNAGVTWWGHYFGGAGVFRVWSNPERQALFNSKIPKHLPIWVPAQSFTSDPHQEALQAVTAARALGFRKVFAVDIEENSGYTLEWGNAFCTVVNADGFALAAYHGGDKEPPINAYGWLANWIGNPPSSIPAGAAQQYRGATNAYGMSVDFDAAGDSFPLELNPVLFNTQQLPELDNMQISIDGKVIVGNDPTDGPNKNNVVCFTLGPNGWDVIDVTDQASNRAHQNNPADTRMYRAV